MIHNILALAEKELRQFFSSPIAYVLIAFFLGVTGLFYFLALIFTKQADMSSAFMITSILFLFICPLITMRMIAEERKSGTMEVLLTAPLTEMEVILGKFFGAVGMLVIMLLLTAHYPIILFIFGKPDKLPVLTGYLGLVLLGSCYLSLGLFASSFARNQIVAAIAGFGFILLLWMMSALSEVVPAVMGDVVKYISFYDHFEDFLRGMLDTKHFIFYVSFIGFVLYLTVLNLRYRKWR